MSFETFKNTSRASAESAIETKEVDIESTEFVQHSEELIDTALDSIKNDFEREEDKNKLEYHNREHTKTVIDRTEKILLAIQEGGMNISEKDIALGKVAAAGHDTVQRWEPLEKDGKIIRKRFIGKNEKQSAEKIIQEMDKINTAQGKEIFNEEDKKAVSNAIDVTVPDFNPELMTVVQPNLEESSSPLTRALALADIGTAGMDGPDAYLREGNEIFIEENLDMQDLDFESMGDEDKKSYQKRMVDWTNFQISFADGRKILLEKELRDLPDSAKEKVKELFDKFDESIDAAKSQAEERAKLSPEELYADMGYRITELV